MGFLMTTNIPFHNNLTHEEYYRSMGVTCNCKMTTIQPKQPRLIHEIARDIRLHWANVYYGAEPYLAAMETIYNIKDSYGLDSAESIITYFLANAGGFRGEHARRLKAELKALLTN